MLDFVKHLSSVFARGCQSLEVQSITFILTVELTVTGVGTYVASPGFCILGYAGFLLMFSFAETSGN